MAKIHVNDLAVLRQREAELLTTLTAVREAIQLIIYAQPTDAGGGPVEKPTEFDEGIARLMNQVLAALGVQFTSSEIFETAKRMKPGCDRMSLLKAMNRLQKNGVIKKIEAGSAWRSARFEKIFKH
jgi:hypothetical protein